MAGLTLTTAGASAVVACGSTKAAHSQAQDEINQITNVLGPHPQLVTYYDPFTAVTNPSVTDDITIALVNQLAQYGVTLTTEQLQHISYSGTAINTTKYSDVSLKVVYGSNDQATLNIKVKMITQANTVTSVGQNITKRTAKTPITLAYQATKQKKLANYLADIQTWLVQNYLLPERFKNEVTLTAGAASTITWTATAFNFMFTLKDEANLPAQTAYTDTFAANAKLVGGQAENVAQKITSALGQNPTLSIYYDTPTLVSDPLITRDINYALKDAVPSLTADQLQNISYTSSTKIKPGAADPINVTLTVKYNDEPEDHITLPIKVKMLNKAATTNTVANKINGYFNATKLHPNGLRINYNNQPNEPQTMKNYITLIQQRLVELHLLPARFATKFVVAGSSPHPVIKGVNIYSFTFRYDGSDPTYDRSFRGLKINIIDSQAEYLAHTITSSVLGETPHLSIYYDTPIFVNNPLITRDINYALVQQIPSLTVADLSHISYQGHVLNPGKGYVGNQQLNINYPSTTNAPASHYTLQIKIQMLDEAKTSQAVANHIAQAVSHGNPITIQYNGDLPKQVLASYNTPIQQWLVKNKLIPPRFATKFVTSGTAALTNPITSGELQQFSFTFRLNSKFYTTLNGIWVQFS